MKSVIIMLLGFFCAGKIVGQKVKTTVILEIISVKPDSIWVSSQGAVYYAKPNKDNKYILNFETTSPLLARIGFDLPKKASLSLFLEKGDHLNIKTDFDKVTNFSGKGAGNARIYYRFNKEYLDAYMTLDAKKLTATEVFNKLAEMWQHSIDILNTNKKNVTPAFYDYQSVSLYYQKLGSGIIIPFLYHAGLGKKTSESIPDGFWDIQKHVKFDEKLLSNPDYAGFIKGSFIRFLNYKDKFERGLLDSTFSKEDDMTVNLSLVEKAYRGKIRKVTLESILLSSLGTVKDLSLVKPLIDSYIAKYTSTAEAKLLLQAYEKQNTLAAGKTPPSFVVKDLDGKDVTLKDYAGKVIYVDFWASWCSPCRNEMQNGSPKLHEKFKDNKDVVFMYISLDSKTDAWRKAILDDKIEGVHVLSQATSGVNSPAAKVFNVSGIPRYVIIGKDGKIFDNNASRPSEEGTVQKINDALQK